MVQPKTIAPQYGAMVQPKTVAAQYQTYLKPCQKTRCLSNTVKSVMGVGCVYYFKMSDSTIIPFIPTF